ncbi:MULTISPECIES: hypothetical protein [Burkholderia]|uniref:hypothetical protein n=1 Tax=Burkholderia TaxID=32008 RepID=UPI00158292C6|nr:MULTISPECIES: hypothetical protein [Burkholderia]
MCWVEMRADGAIALCRLNSVGARTHAPARFTVRIARTARPVAGGLKTPSGHFHRPVIVAMIAMRMMKVSVDQIVDVIAMRYRFVPATGPMDVTCLVATAARRTPVRVLRADLDPVFVDVIAVRMVQMAVVQVVDVVAMPDGGVTAARTMLMVVVGMMGFVARAHAYLLDLQGASP